MTRIQSFFSNDDYWCLRRHIFTFAEQICDYLKINTNLKVLEVGPSFSNFKEQTFPQFSTEIIKKCCNDNNIYYKTLDIDSNSSCDYIANLEDLTNINDKFDIIILLQVLEHVKKVFKVPEQLYKITNSSAHLFINTPFLFKVHGPIPDCWRFSQYGIESLFEDFFHIYSIDTFPPNEIGKNSFPLSLNTIMVRND